MSSSRLLSYIVVLIVCSRIELIVMLWLLRLLVCFCVVSGRKDVVVSSVVISVGVYEC